MLLFLLLVLLSLDSTSMAQSPPSFRPSLISPSGHLSYVSDVAFSPDGGLLATAGGDGQWKLWDPRSGNLMFTMPAHEAPIESLVWNPKGQAFATAGSDHTVKVWSSETGQLMLTIPDHHVPDRGVFDWPGSTIAWSPDGSMLVTMSQGSGIVWSLSEGAVVSRLPHERVMSVSWSEDGGITTCGMDEVRTWKIRDDSKPLVKTLRSLRSTSGANDEFKEYWEPTEAAWAPGGSMLAICYSGTPIRLDDSEKFEAAPIEGRRLYWHPSEAVLFSNNRILDVHRGSFVEIEGHESDPRPRPDGPLDEVAGWSPNGQLLATGGPDWKVKVWDRSGQLMMTLDGHVRPIMNLDWGPNSKLLASGSYDGTCRLWDIETGRLVAVLGGELAYQHTVSFSPDGEILASAGGELLALWSKKDGRPIAALRPEKPFNPVADQLPQVRVTADGAIRHPDRVCLSWGPESRQLAIGHKDIDRGGEIWDTVTNRRQSFIEDWVWDIEWAPDGKSIWTANRDEIQLWSATTKQQLKTFSFPGGPMYNEVADVAPDPSGRTVLTGMSPFSDYRSTSGRGGESVKIPFYGETVLRKVPSGVPIRVLEEARPPISWSRVPNLVATGGPLGSLLVWDGVDVRRLQGGDHRIAALAWGPNGNDLASTDEIGNTRIWNLTAGSSLELKKREMNTGLPPNWSQVNASLTWHPKLPILVTAETDQKIQVWNPLSGELLASCFLFEQGEDWLVISPEGFFDGSQRAWSRISWRMGPNVLDVAEPERFFNEFYQPGLLRDVLENCKPIAQVLRERKDLRADMTIASKDRRSVFVGFENVDALKRSSQSTVDIDLRIGEAPPDGKHREGSGLKDVRLFRNGILVWRSDPGASLSDGTVTIEDVPLVAGENRFVAYAFNGENIKSRDAELVLTGPDSLAREPHAYILAIGVDRYENKDLDLKFADDDAKDLAEQLVVSLPFAEGNVHPKPLLNEEATKENILAEIDRLAKVTRPEDTVIVSFAGHGIKYQERFYLVPHDTGAGGSLKQLASHGVSDEELEKHFAPLQAAHIALIIDACHSGEALEAEEWRVGPMNSRGLPQLAWEKGIEILAASQSEETAKELSELGHGLLTSALLRGFGEAPRKQDKLLAFDWLEFAAAEVPRSLAGKPEYTSQGSLKTNSGRPRHDARGYALYEPKTAPLVQTPRVFHGREDVVKWAVAR